MLHSLTFVEWIAETVRTSSSTAAFFCSMQIAVKHLPAGAPHGSGPDQCRLLTSTFLLAHLMAQDLIKQAPAMLSRVQTSPAIFKVVTKRQADRRASASSLWPGSLTGDSPPRMRMLELPIAKSLREMLSCERSSQGNPPDKEGWSSSGRSFSIKEVTPIGEG